MTYSNDRMVLFIDAPKASGCYVVEASNDEDTKTRLDSDAQDAGARLGETGADWTANDAALKLEEKGWKMTWLDVVEVAL